MNIINLVVLLACVVASQSEMLDVCADSCVQQNCIGKMFILTPAKASFQKSRGMCLALGGDVVQEVVSEEGKKYHSQMQAITSAASSSGLGHIWIGLTDVYEETKWRFWSSGSEFDASTAAFDWLNASDYDEDTSENCAAVHDDHLHDFDCDSSFYALCEIESNLC